MSSIKLLGETSGEVILKAPAIAGASEVTLPTGTVDLANYVTATYTGNLDITGNGTFSGDFTVDTSTLKVDSTNNRVGIGTASPTESLQVSSGNILLDNDQVIKFGDGSAYISGNGTSDYLKFFTANSNEMTLESDGDLHVDGDVIAFSTTTPSDIALKSDIEMIPNALDKIDEVRGVTFTRHNGQKSAGIIAQELEKVLPEAVKDKKLSALNKKTYKTVEYDAIHGLLINCIKELKEEIKELKNAITK